MSDVSGAVPRFSIDRRMTILVLFVTTLVVGVVATAGMPIELIPQGFENPFLMVLVPWGNAPPEEIEDKIVLPLEEQLSTIRGIDRITTVASANRAHAMVVFKQGTDMSVAYREVRDRIERARASFPADVDQVFIRQDDPAALPAYVLGVGVDPAVSDPYELIEQEIVLPLSRLPGVASVQVTGTERREISVDLDRELTEAAGLDIYQVAQALSQDNFTMTSGHVLEAGRKIPLRSVARYRSLDELRQSRVSPTVRLAQIATVRFEAPPRQMIVRAMGKPAVALVVLKEGGANGRAVSSRVAELVESFRANPRLAGFDLFRLFSQSEVVDETLEALLDSGLIGGLIACIVLLFFLQRVRLMIVVALSIPLSVLIALTAMFFLGETLNMLSLLGLMLTIGMLVDNSVVVAENIHRLHREGARRRDAAIRGTSEMTLAVTMSTLTTIVVFVPAALTEGANQFFLIRLAIPVSMSLLASLAVALVLMPLCVYVMLPADARPPGLPGRANAARDRLRRALAWAYRASMGASASGYQAALAYFLRHRLSLVMLASVLFGASLLGMWTEQVRFIGIQREEQAGFDFIIELPDGTTLEETSAWFLEAERRLAEDKRRLGIEGWLISYRRASGRVRGWFEQPRQAELTFRQAAQRVGELLPEFPGISVYAQEESQVQAELGERFYQIRLYGEDPRELEATAASIEQALARLDGVIGVQKSGDDQPNQLGLVIDRTRSRRYGANPRVIAGLVSYALRGSSLPKFGIDGREVPVTIRYNEADRRNLQQLESFRVPTDSGQPLSIGSLTDPQFLATPLQIVRINKRVSRSITLELAEDQQLATRKRLNEIFAGIDLPEGITVSADTGRRQLARNVAGLRMTILLSIVFIYLLMGFLFESFVLPLSILTTIPLAFIGVFSIHRIAGLDLDTLGAVGFVLLVGVVVNNGIVLVDSINRLRVPGRGRSDAILLATRRRFRPIMMTAITTIGGLIPLALAGRNTFGLSYASFSLTLIGGLTTATALTLLVIPVFYSLIDDARAACSEAIRHGSRVGAGRYPRLPQASPDGR